MITAPVIKELREELLVEEIFAEFIFAIQSFQEKFGEIIFAINYDLVQKKFAEFSLVSSVCIIC